MNRHHWLVVLGACQVIAGLGLALYTPWTILRLHSVAWERTGHVLMCGIDLEPLNELVRRERIGPEFRREHLGYETWDGSAAAESLADWIRAGDRDYQTGGYVGALICLTLGGTTILLAWPRPPVR